MHRGDENMHLWIMPSIVQVLVVACSVPSHYLKQWLLFVNLTPRNIFEWNFNKNSNIFIQENGLETVVSQKWAILFWPQCVMGKLSEYSGRTRSIPWLLLPHNIRPSAAIVFTMHDKLVLVFHEKGCQLPVPSQCWEMIENEDMFLCLLRTIKHVVNSLWPNDAIHMATQI